MSVVSHSYGWMGVAGIEIASRVHTRYRQDVSVAYREMPERFMCAG